MTGAPPIVLRAKHDQDIPKIFRDWLKSYRSKGPGCATIPNEVYYWWQHRLIEVLWMDPAVGWAIATDRQDSAKIYGWLCYQRAESEAGDVPVIHYVYVNKLFRRLGVATALLNASDGRPEKTLPIAVTSITPAGRELMSKRVYVYNPYLLWARVPAPGPSPGTKIGSPRTTGSRSPFRGSRIAIAAHGFARKPGYEEPDEDEVA
jgi:GNAT superfamily N-acetyltransferase